MLQIRIRGLFFVNVRVCVCVCVCVYLCVVFFGRLEILGMLQTFIVSTTSLNKIERGKKFPMPFLKGILNYVLNIFSCITLGIHSAIFYKSKQSIGENCGVMNLDHAVM